MRRLRGNSLLLSVTSGNRGYITNNVSTNKEEENMKFNAFWHILLEEVIKMLNVQPAGANHTRLEVSAVHLLATDWRAVYYDVDPKTVEDIERMSSSIGKLNMKLLEEYFPDEELQAFILENQNLLLVTTIQLLLERFVVECSSDHKKNTESSPPREVSTKTVTLS